MNKLIIAGFIFLLKAHCVFAQPLAYITNAATPSSIALCQIDSTTGQFISCEAQFLENLSTPLDIALATIVGKTYAFIANSNWPAFVTQCEVHSSGQLQACILTDVPSYAGIALHQSDAHYAYISRTDSVQKCWFTEDKLLNAAHCQDSGAGNLFTNGPMSITFQTIDEITYAYVANGDYHVNASVMQCQVMANGDFAHCLNAAVEHDFNGVADIDFATLDKHTYAYVTEPGGQVSYCLVNKKGLFHTCEATGGTFHSPIGISIQTINHKLYAYIVDGGFRTPCANQVMQCLIEASGNLDCNDSGAGRVFENPFGISL